MLKRGDWISFPESFQIFSVGLSHHPTTTLPSVAAETNNCSKSFLQRWFDTSMRCHVYICTSQWAYSAPAPRPLLPLWWELNCSGWKQLGAKLENEKNQCVFVCMCVCERDTRPDQCQHVGLIRLVITAWKRGERARWGREHTLERMERKCGQRRRMTEGKCDGGWFNDEWRIGLSYLLKRGRGAKRASASLPHTCL